MTTTQTTYEPATFADLQGWDGDDHLAAFRAFLTTCGPVIRNADANAALAAAPDATADVIKADAKSAQLAEACRAAQALARPTRAEAKTFFETHFQPHRVLHKGNAGMLTGYYEPVLEGSRTPTAEFKVPIYRRPPDLVNVVAETERASASVSGALSHVRKTAAGTAPFPTRAEIENGALAGQGLELVYLNCPVDAFFMHIQGSARIKLQDGSIVRLNYDGKNGHPYSSIGRYLIDHGLLAADKVSLQALQEVAARRPRAGAPGHVAERVVHLFPRARRHRGERGPARSAQHGADAGAQPRRRHGLSPARLARLGQRAYSEAREQERL